MPKRGRGKAAAKTRGGEDGEAEGVKMPLPMPPTTLR